VQEVLIDDVTSEKWNFSVKSGSPALSGAAAPSGEFFDPAGKDFIGACGTSCTEFDGWTTKAAP
jgi:hypothetical protein